MSHATPQGTTKYSEKFPGLPYRTFGKTGLKTSTVGFGCYRVSDEIPEHIDALTLALKSGVNLIDTSTNYADGGSERCVGKVIRELSNSIPREEIIVVSKVGYVQGENFEMAVARERDQKPYPEMVKYADGCWHCLHPDFIREQFQRTLDRTGLSEIDCYLLHNPEYFFSDLVHRGETGNMVAAREEFYRRIEAAFKTLEELVQAGRLQSYGVSSNTFGKPEADPEMTSISQMWEAAKRAGGEKNHFVAIQLPLNIFESGPYFEDNNDGQTTLEFCQKNNIAVLVNRPLNAFYQNGLIRLSDFKTRTPFKGQTELQKNSDAIAEFLNPHLPEEIHTESLSRKALAMVMQTPGVTCVLNGMRTGEYVEDAVGATKLQFPFNAKLYYPM